jgi:hypothetical protein
MNTNGPWISRVTLMRTLNQRILFAGPRMKYLVVFCFFAALAGSPAVAADNSVRASEKKSNAVYRDRWRSRSRAMKHLVLFCVFDVLAGSSAVAADKPVKYFAIKPNPIYREFAKSIRGNDVRSKSARAALLYAEGRDPGPRGLERRPVKTVDGKKAEVVFLRVWGGFPGEDFAMALLLIDGRTVDWASCWIDTRNGSQELLLEDVDGDGIADIAFRARDVFWGGIAEREQRRPRDERSWLAAYSIASNGLKPIFAKQNRVHHAIRTFGKPSSPLAFRVTGLSGTLVESDLYECTVSVTNVSKAPVASSSVDFFPQFVNCGGSGIGHSFDALPALIQPGQTVSQAIMIHLEADQDTVALRWGEPRT